MAFCVACGETLSLEAKSCPNCARPVGLSSIGPALERQAGKGRIRLLKAAAALVVLVVVLGLVARLWPSRALPSQTELEEAARVAAPSLVRLSGSDGRESGAVVLRRYGTRLLLIAPATVAPAGRVLEVSGPGGSVKGVSLFSGGAPEIDQLSIVFVPDMGPLQVSEARLATRPARDLPLLTLTTAAQPASVGVVLSFEDGPEPGSLVHDASLSVAERGYGLWAPDGKLFALPTFAPVRGESLALSAAALRERLLVHEVTLLSDGAFSEHSLPLSKGTRVGVAAQGKKLEVKLGSAQLRRGREAFGGWRTFDGSTLDERPIQIAVEGGRGGALVVTLAPF